jgi:hypothetical protein
MTMSTAAKSKPAKAKREPNTREKKIIAAKARKTARHRRNARHG